MTITANRPRPALGRVRSRAAVVALVSVLIASAAVAGCGGGGTTSGDPVTYVLSRDFGGELLERRQIESLGRGATVMRLLQREFGAVKTSYGGRFVTEIKGQAAQRDPAIDWVYYLNGAESEVGAADVQVRPGDHVQWDLHRWEASERVNRTVGAFPRPLDRRAVRLECVQAKRACALARQRLATAGIEIAASPDLIADDIVVVGRWPAIADAEGIPDLAAGPQQSGVFASFTGAGLVVRGADGGGVLTYKAGAGLVAAVARGERGSTWIVSGTDAEGTERAAGLLERGVLANKVAIASDGESLVSLPLTLGQ